MSMSSYILFVFTLVYLAECLSFSHIKKRPQPLNHSSIEIVIIVLASWINPYYPAPVHDDLQPHDGISPSYL